MAQGKTYSKWGKYTKNPTGNKYFSTEGSIQKSWLNHQVNSQKYIIDYIRMINILYLSSFLQCFRRNPPSWQIFLDHVFMMFMSASMTFRDCGFSWEGMVMSVVFQRSFWFFYCSVRFLCRSNGEMMSMMMFLCCFYSQFCERGGGCSYGFWGCCLG